MSVIEGKTIWVTGASSGIGQALAQRLADHNNFVIISSRSRESLLDVQKASPKRIRVLPCDVSDDGAMDQAGRELAELTDQLDLVVACAGTCEYDNGLQLDSASYRRVFDANFFGVVNTLRQALPLLARSKAPVFAAVGSLSSVVGFPRAEAYGASKAALGYFLDAVRADLSRTCLKVVHIRPGFIDTPLTERNDFDMPFLMTPEAAAERIERGLARGHSTIDFPKRLSWSLRFFGFFRSLWFRISAPRMTRIRSLASRQ
ncbi:SDR family NAD(P)-dependent oxidoreductase [Microbulbifer yueqingensis]|uniref:Short-chain dehydrogenase n=1 Tax=Microbulbifer yueqingensis TaxID=658219 RepID=A0A1G8ZAM5_9GAMM|nr:SDR family NAD(P)-dependent oxidoreductase [Microbulbifer yueqingensis]SDK12068.1 Short-chain dehydrogenase [Microbulbifer yueqingensis]